MNNNADYEKIDVSVIEGQARTQLRQMENQLDDDIRQQLAESRRRAVDKAGHWWSSWWLSLRFTVPATGMALASVVALVLIFSPVTDNGLPGQAAPDNRLSENVEFYEDLDFYYWLAETESDLRG